MKRYFLAALGALVLFAITMGIVIGFDYAKEFIGNRYGETGQRVLLGTVTVIVFVLMTMNLAKPR